MDQDIIKLIDKLADKLGVASEHLMQVLYRQAYIELVYDVILMILFVVYVIAVWKIHKWLGREYNVKVGDRIVTYESRYEYYESPAWLMGILLLISIIWSICVVNDIGEIITIIFNPEYWVIDTIFQALKGKS